MNHKFKIGSIVQNKNHPKRTGIVVGHKTNHYKIYYISHDRSEFKGTQLAPLKSFIDIYYICLSK